MSERVSKQVEGWIDKALVDQGHADEVAWDCSLLPTPEGFQLLVAMWMSGAILGTLLHFAQMISNPPLLTEESVVSIVRDMVEGLNQERSKQLQSVSNGKPSDETAKSVILPGGTDGT